MVGHLTADVLKILSVIAHWIPLMSKHDVLGIGELKMDWPLRLKVALGAARGLAYLHSSSDVGIPIVHRDFKSTNILLDGNYEAKVRISNLHSQHILPKQF